MPVPAHYLITSDWSYVQHLDNLRALVAQTESYHDTARELTKTYTTNGLMAMARRLVYLAEQAYSLHQIDVVEKISQILTNIPIPRIYENIPSYYRAQLLLNEGQTDKAQYLLVKVFEEAPPIYRARALASLGATYFETNDLQTALFIYNETKRLISRNESFDPSTIMRTYKMLAVIKATSGNHRDALNTLENIYQLANGVRVLYPSLYYDYLNSLAVELLEANRIEEAFNCISIVLKSPYSDAYPEYQETKIELLLKSGHLPNPIPKIRHKASVTVVGQRSLGENVVMLPAQQQTLNGDLTKYETSIPQHARVLRFRDYMKLAKEKSAVSNQIEGSGAYSLWKKRKRIFDLLALPEMTEEKLDKAIEVLEGAIPE
jgi:tetratricopeptide (TPR) repeat protein